MSRSSSSSGCDAPERATSGARQPRTPRNRTGRRTFAVLAGCLVLLALGPVAVAQAITPASISGTVTNVKGEDLSGIEVKAFNEHGIISETTTAPNGTYTVSGLSEGEYSLEFSSSEYVTQTRTIVLEESQAKTGVNAEMQKSGSLSGTVTSATTGNGLGNIGVFAEKVSGAAEEFNGFGSTEPDGNYTIAGLPPGGYVIEFEPFEANYLSASIAGVTLKEGEKLTNLNTQLQEGGRISGTVTSATTKKGLANVEVFASGQTGGAGFGEATTNANGEYTISGLPTGSYKVEFELEKYITQYFNNQSLFTSANLVGVTQPNTSSGINAALVTDTPANTSAPVAYGTPAVGQTLLCSNGSWTGSPAPTFAYQWLRDGSAIAGAASVAYVAQAADQGHALSCEATGTNGYGHASAKSSNSLAVPAPPPALLKVPTVTLVGSTSTLAVSKNATKVRIACAQAPCVGSIEVVERIVIERRKGNKRIVKKVTIVLAKGTYSLAAGKTATITLKVTPPGKRKLAHARRHRLSGKLLVKVKGGKSLEKTVLLG